MREEGREGGRRGGREGGGEGGRKGGREGEREGGFSDHIFTTTKVEFITAKIAFIFIS